MTLKVTVTEGRSLTKTVALEGRLDNDSVDELDNVLDPLLETAFKVLVFDLGKLEYITSAGLRSIFRAQKTMHARAGKMLLVNPQPQVQKVLDIVKVPELGAIIKDIQELDAYLDQMQKKVAEGE